MSEIGAHKIGPVTGGREAVTGRILLVDDEGQNLRMLKAMLAPAGHEILTAGNGPEALEMVRDHEPDLILLDVMMPGMDGYEVLSRVRGHATGSDIPVIMVTSLDDTRSRVRALEAGADDFVTKPVTKAILSARVDSLLKVKAYHDTLRDRREFLEVEVARHTESLQRYSRQLEILNQAGIMIHSVLDATSILRSVTQAALELWPSDGGAAGIVGNGGLHFHDWYWEGKRQTGSFRCHILGRILNMKNFMEIVSCEKGVNGSCVAASSTGGKIRECLAVPIHDRQLQVQACLLLFNPDDSFAEKNLIENPLPGLVSSAATALANTRNMAQLKEKEEQLQQSLNEKELLLKEIHHRVKNNLQAVVGLMEAHLGTVRDPRDKQVFLKGQSLAMSISMIHELLYRTDDYTNVDFKRYTESLVRNCLNLYPEAGDSVRVHVRMDKVNLNTDTAIPMSLIINELVTNALIHAYPENREGSVTISLDKMVDGSFKLQVIDDGVGIADQENGGERQSLGLSLVQSLVENLHGAMEVTANGGTRVVIHFREYRECEDLELG